MTKPGKRSFAPVAGRDAKAIVLGSMPGEQSLVAGEYYAHPRNRFWQVMGLLIGAGPEAPYAERLRILKQHRIALWDVLEYCERSGSLDARIVRSTERPNDFAGFLRRHRQIRDIFFNGKKAAEVFRTRVMPSLPKPVRPVLHELPSTSPANARWRLPELRRAWRVVVDVP